MAKFATGKYAKAISDRSGMEFPYKEMVREWNGSFVHISEFEPKQPQLEPKPMNGDAISIRNVRPSRTAPAVAYSIPEDGFKTYQAGSGIINVTAPGHGLTNGTTYRFRGVPTTAPGTGTPTNAVFAYANPGSFELIQEVLIVLQVPILQKQPVIQLQQENMSAIQVMETLEEIRLITLLRIFFILQLIQILLQRVEYQEEA
jgi:hypothetical protein